MTALVTSPMAREVASCGSECSMCMWRCTFSMTTMASSTTRPVASVMPKRVSELMEKPKMRDEGEGADERNRNGDGGNDGGAPVEQEEKDDSDDDDDGLGQRDQHFADRVADGGGGVEGDGVLKARRESSWRAAPARPWPCGPPPARWRSRAAPRRCPSRSCPAYFSAVL